jgi:hypothetical protein
MVLTFRRQTAQLRRETEHEAFEEGYKASPRIHHGRRTKMDAHYIVATKLLHYERWTTTKDCVGVIITRPVQEHQHTLLFSSRHLKLEAWDLKGGKEMSSCDLHD